MKEKYSFMPAAVFYKDHGGLGVYVKYKGIESNSIRIKDYRPNYLWLDCPDRELVIVSDHNKMESFVPMDCNYDEFFDLNYINEENNERIKTLMFNFVQHNKQPSPEIRRNGVNDKKITYVADSGGFQLMTEKIDFVDPREVANWYSKNIDLGMVLDIPITDDEMQEDLVKRLAKVQKRNTDILLDNIAPHVELLNIVHGISPKNKKIYEDIVFDEKIDRLALGGMYYQNIVFTTNDLYTMIQNNKHYKHLHILGVYNVAQLAIIIKLANSKNNNMFITTDASTPIQSARSKLMHLQLFQKYPPRRCDIGDSSRIPSIYNYKNCQCKVCRSIKYVDILGSIDNAISTFVLAYHNVFEISRMTRQMNDICANSSYFEYKTFIKSLLRNHRSASYTYQSMDFIEHADRHGLEAARRRYQHYLNISSLSKTFDPKPLFQNGSISNSDKPEDKDEIFDEDYNSKYKELALKYEEFHENMTENIVETREIKNRKKSKKGSGRSSGVVKASGLKSQMKKIKKSKPKD